jgi:uncharacterized membrane protein
MAFCPNCGAQVSGTFCPNCGTNVAAAQNAGTAGAGGTGAAGAGAGAASGATYVPPGPPPIQAAGLTDNVAGALCYLAGLITGIIFLVIAPYNQNKFVRFHAFQAIFAHIAVIVLWIAYAIVAGILTFLTHGLGFFLYPLFGLLIFVIWLYLMYSAYNGKKVKLPVIGDLAERQA